MALTQRLALQQGKQRGNAGAHRGWSSRQAARARASAAQEEAMVDPDTGLEKRKDGVKKEKEEDILTPRFYTTDFDEMERLFNPELNPQLNQDELKACLEEFRQDYNQKHFVRNEEFKQAAEQCTGETRRIMVEFLERSCTAEFSGFLLYKELGRRLKNINPTVAEIFSLMSRDEARHSGFLNKAMGDFNLSLDLGFMTKNRQYTFFKPKFIFYAVWLSEKIGYWRYITIYRHLQQNPEYCYYPIFKFFENWCQDENRHGDFFGAVLKSQPQFLRGWEARQWSKFFCLSVYVTMYVNDHQRRTFYESLGLDPTQFDMHVLHQTNKTTAGLFPIVPDTYDPAFKRNLDGLCEVNYALIDMNEKGANFVQKVPQFLKAAKHLFALWTMPMIEQGSVDVSDSSVMPAAF